MDTLVRILPKSGITIDVLGRILNQYEYREYAQKPIYAPKMVEYLKKIEIFQKKSFLLFKKKLK